MSKKNRNSGKGPLTESDGLTNNPFGALGGLDLPPGPTTPRVQQPSAPTKRPTLRIRLEKKGRGGKTVTVIDGFPAEDAALAKDLRKSLGTGGTHYEDVLELQGDKRSQAAEWLRNQGFPVKGA